VFLLASVEREISKWLYGVKGLVVPAVSFQPIGFAPGSLLFQLGTVGTQIRRVFGVAVEATFAEIPGGVAGARFPAFAFWSFGHSFLPLIISARAFGDSHHILETSSMVIVAGFCF
jgi:hypothetical protein